MEQYIIELLNQNDEVVYEEYITCYEETVMEQAKTILLLATNYGATKISIRNVKDI